MDILYTLIPLSILLVFAILVALAWAAHSGQFEDLDVEAERILLDDDFAPPPADGQPAAPRPAGAVSSPNPPDTKPPAPTPHT